jgi:predicted PurR-regulated permease PerM
MFEYKLFRAGVWVLLLFLIIWVGIHISFIFIPFIVLVQTIFVPLLLSGILFYLLRPIVDLLEKQKVPRMLSVLLIYLSFFGLLVFLGIFFGPVIRVQVEYLVQNAPQLARGLEEQLIGLQETPFVARLLAVESINFQLDDAARQLTVFVNEVFESVRENVLDFAGAIANIILIFVTIPFLLFYMLKDARKLPDALVFFLPQEHKEEGKKIIHSLDRTLSSYIQGIIIVSLAVGVMAYVGFRIVGLNFALTLALVAAVTNVVPFFGPFIGTIPAVIVGFVQSPLTALKVLGVVIIAQQVESNLISPQVLGKKLSIHPVVIIFLVMAAGRFAGFLGIILAIPTFAVARVVAVHLYRLAGLHMKDGKK